MSQEQSQALIEIEKINPVAVFTQDGIKPVIARIEQIGRELVPDTSTGKGRQEIKSLAFKIARSKTLLDDAGKKYVADIKAKVKIVDGARKEARDRLDALKDEVRKPLTEWEDEQARIKAEEERKEQVRIERIKELINANFGHQRLSDLHSKPSIQIQSRIKRVSDTEITESDYQEFAVDADLAKSGLLSAMTELFHATRQREQEDAERKAEEARLAEERERLAEIQQKQEAARKEEEAKLQAEQDRQEKERQKFEAEKREFEAQKQADEDARQAQLKAEQEAKEQAEQAKAEEEAKANTAPEKAVDPEPSRKLSTITLTITSDATDNEVMDVVSQALKLAGITATVFTSSTQSHAA